MKKIVRCGGFILGLNCEKAVYRIITREVKLGLSVDDDFRKIDFLRARECIFMLMRVYKQDTIFIVKSFLHEDRIVYIPSGVKSCVPKRRKPIVQLKPKIYIHSNYL